MQKVSARSQARAQALRNINATSDIERRLDQFVALLDRWRKITNLVSPASFDAVWTRHVEDCAQLAGLEPNASRWIDLGSGAGFPALVIAIQLSERPGTWVHCIESDRRKCAFLREVARVAAIPVTVHASRIEDFDTQAISPVDVVTARAFAPMSRLLEFSRPWIQGGAVGLFPRGRTGDIQFDRLPPLREFQFDLLPSKTKIEGFVIRVRRAPKDRQ